MPTVSSYTLLSMALLTILLAHRVARGLIQTVSNIVTANPKLIDSLWNAYLNVPEEKSILV